MNAQRILILSTLVIVCDATVTKAEEGAKHCMNHKRAIGVEFKGRNNRNKEGVDKQTQEVLARFANIFMSFLGILQNPDNPTEHVVNMVTGAVQMVAEAIKSGQLSLDAHDDIIRAYATHMTRDVEPMLKKIVM